MIRILQIEIVGFLLLCVSFAVAEVCLAVVEETRRVLVVMLFGMVWIVSVVVFGVTTLAMVLAICPRIVQ